ncbi:hypothetical protein BDV12DRAFT_31932 [Aspergillus spectabilis]
MEPEIEFVCPRPRNTRACDKCRARKIRCLPGKRPSEVDTCQRCSKFGYACTYEPASQPTRLVTQHIMPSTDLLTTTPTERRTLPNINQKTAARLQTQATMLSLVSSRIPQNRRTTLPNSSPSTAAPFKRN